MAAQRRRVRIFELSFVPYKYNSDEKHDQQSSALDFLDIAELDSVFQDKDFQIELLRLLRPSGGENPNTADTDREESPEPDYSKRKSRVDKIKKRKIPYIKIVKDPIYVDEKDPNYARYIMDTHHAISEKINRRIKNGTYVGSSKNKMQLYTYSLTVVGKRRDLAIAQYFFNILADNEIPPDIQTPLELEEMPKPLIQAIMKFRSLGLQAVVISRELEGEDDIDRKFSFRRKSKVVRRKSKVVRRKSKVVRRKSKKSKSKKVKRKL